MRILLPVMLCLTAGCSDSLVDRDPARNKPLQPKATDDIGEFQGDGNVVDQKVEITNPITGPLEAFEPTKQRLAKLGIEHAVNLFHALEGRYPKDYDEFMQRVIKENNMRLPELGKGFRYQYDVDKHELVIVESEEEGGQD